MVWIARLPSGYRWAPKTMASPRWVLASTIPKWFLPIEWWWWDDNTEEGWQSDHQMIVGILETLLSVLDCATAFLPSHGLPMYLSSHWPMSKKSSDRCQIWSFSLNLHSYRVVCKNATAACQFLIPPCSHLPKLMKKLAFMLQCGGIWNTSCGRSLKGKYKMNQDLT